MKKWICILISSMLALTTSLSIPVNADYKSIEIMTREEKDSTIESLIRSLYSGNQEEFMKISPLFTSDCYYEISDYISSGGIGNGAITNIVTDYIEVINSSDVDYVEMINIKVNRGNSEYLYLLEFHVDYSGEIYGFNIWQY